MFNTLDDLIASFNYKKELYEEYLNNLYLEKFKELVNKPNFFKTTTQKLRFLVIFKEHLEKKKIILQNIGTNDLDSLLESVDNNPLMSYLLTDCASLNYLLEIASQDKASKLLDYIFQKTISLDVLNFNEKNQELIEKYIEINLENDDVLDKIFNVYSNNIYSRWGEFIIKKIASLHAFDLFIEYYKELIFSTYLDEFGDEIFELEHNINEQKKFINMFFLSIKALNLEPKFKKMMISMFVVRLQPNEFEKFILYLNNAFGDNEVVATMILNDQALVKHVNISSIITYFKKSNIKKLVKINKDVKDLSHEELEDIFLNMNLNKALINKLNSRLIISTFDNIISNNERVFDVLKVFLKKYFTYEKAVLFISLLGIENEKAINIINSAFNKKITNISKEASNILNNAILKIINLDENIDEDFKSIYPELLDITYNKDFFDILKKLCFKFNKLEYLQIFYSQYLKKIV